MSTCRRCRVPSTSRSSGRTSFPVDKLLDRDAYRVLGYRQCGERAVRVDILERLADLIRPALSWREASPGAKPAGAFDGRGFVVTQAMTSLTGSAGEDFASILRALGYRMERRQPLPPKPAVVETAAAEPSCLSQVWLSQVVEPSLVEPAAEPAESGRTGRSRSPAGPSAALLPDARYRRTRQPTKPVAVEPESAERESVESKAARPPVEAEAVEAAPIEAASAATQPDSPPAIEADAVEARNQQAVGRTRTGARWRFGCGGNRRGGNGGARCCRGAGNG